MVFKCQEDSYLTEFSSTVVKCEPTKEPIVEYGKTSKFEGYQVILEDTILFPAGGGQPHDVGWLNNVEVFQVVRKGNQALHFTKEPLTEGSVVTQKIKWSRRFDHMQQHSGQHLLSAVLDKRNMPTTSWWLGAEESYVELDTTNISNEDRKILSGLSKGLSDSNSHETLKILKPNISTTKLHKSA